MLSPQACRYEDGKYKQKKNTFTDFIAAAEHLIAENYTNSARLCIEVRSLSTFGVIPGKSELT